MVQIYERRLGRDDGHRRVRAQGPGHRLALALGLSASGIERHREREGLGRLRSFSGLLVTCGLDHVGFMAEESGEHFLYGPRMTVRHSTH